MSKREKAFKDSTREEKSRIKLYKSGKYWVKSGIKEFKLLRMIGFSLLSRHASEETDADGR
ncbi:KxYKxGKxW signal peptide domain-containing protein [Staphylococcus delphini]|uniref:KxYKxGKxW signal peptide domain-containing protein n=1 Tax=Staphylococcus delphini TaxID=53344 RepID=UPI003364D2AF